MVERRESSFTSGEVAGDFFPPRGFCVNALERRSRDGARADVAQRGCWVFLFYYCTACRGLSDGSWDTETCTMPGRRRRMETRLECFYAGTRAEIQVAIDQRLLLKRSHLVPLIVIVGPSSEGKAAVSLCLREEGC